MRFTVTFVGTVFAAMLAIVIGNRLPDDAMALVLGMVLGVIASVPAGIGLLIVLDRHWQRISEEEDMLKSDLHIPSPAVAPPPPPLTGAAAMPSSYYIPREFLVAASK